MIEGIETDMDKAKQCLPLLKWHLEQQERAHQAAWEQEQEEAQEGACQATREQEEVQKGACQAAREHKERRRS